jgi:hypothetical protein
VPYQTLINALLRKKLQEVWQVRGDKYLSSNLIH